MNELSNVLRIKEKIYVIRGIQVMLDSDLAELYHVETKILNRQVKRNIERFPSDFCFQLSREEFINLKCQIGTSSFEHGGRRVNPYMFTGQGNYFFQGSDVGCHQLYRGNNQ